MSEAKKSGRNLTPTVNSRVILMAGFGGLLMLTALAGADGLKALRANREHPTIGFARSFSCERECWSGSGRIFTAPERMSATTCWSRSRAKRKGIATRCWRRGGIWMRRSGAVSSLAEHAARRSHSKR